MKKNCLVLLLCFLSISIILTGCQPRETIYPITEVPNELSIEYDNSDIANIPSPKITKSNEIPSNVTENPADTLANFHFNVSYDNTTGCFFGYTGTHEKDPNDKSCQLFSKVMSSLSNSLEFANGYSTYLLNVDSNSFKWKLQNINIFNQYFSKEIYTDNSGVEFQVGTSPMTMWLDDIQNGNIPNGKSDVNMFISDFNEQSGLISSDGKQFKDYLTENQDKDFLMISLKLPFTGDISAPTFEGEGDISKPVTTKNFENELRNYYIVALGNRNALQSFKTMLDNELYSYEDALNIYSFMYHDYFYNLDNISYYFGDGTENSEHNIITDASKLKLNYQLDNLQFNLSSDSDYLVENLATDNSNPIITAKDDTLETMELENQSTLDEGSSIIDVTNSSLENLEPIQDSTTIFEPNISNYSFIYKNTMSNQNVRGFTFNFQYDELLEYVHLNFDNATTYIYSCLENGENDKIGTSSNYSWQNDISLSKDYGIQISCDNNTISISSDRFLDKNLPVVLVSIPIELDYCSQTSKTSICDISNFNMDEYLQSYKIPDIIESEADKYTKTYKLDAFMDKITNYKSLKVQEFTPDGDDNFSVLPYNKTVSRLNIIITTNLE